MGDYRKFLDDRETSYRRLAREHFQQINQIIPLPESITTFKDLTNQKSVAATDVSITNDKYNIIIDAVELSSSSLSQKPVYYPIIFLPHHKISKEDKLLLAFCGIALNHEQKAEANSGRFMSGDKFCLSKVKLPSLIKAAGKIEKEIGKMMEIQKPPQLRLNDHCKICEFQADCTSAAKGQDDLSLLKGLSGKEIEALNKRGIFTVTQFSYTFRPRRPKKLIEQKIVKHHHSLNALAIRTQTIYISGKPELPTAPTCVYLDVEGIPAENFYYLIGLIIDDGSNVVVHSFWANNMSEEILIWKSFLDVMKYIQDYALFHYGSYETKFIKQMGSKYGGDAELLEKIRLRCFNVLSAIYGRIYFPTYSNDLKSIASFWGFKWSDLQASGLTSVLWRQQWEVEDSNILKQKLLTYNHEDCQALKIVVGYLKGASDIDSVTKYPTKQTHQIKREKPYDIFHSNEFCFPELDKINRCAYFDYQRDKIYLRKNTRARKRLNKIRRRQQISYKVNKEILFRPLRKCPHCHALQLSKYGTTSKLLYDLKIIPGGIKRWVIRYTSTRFICKQCRRVTSSKAYTKLPTIRYGRTLTAWTVYQNIGRLKSMRSIAEDFGEVFGYWFTSRIAFNFKLRAATYYRNTYKKLLKKITHESIVHVDETKANLKEGTGYIWVFANAEAAVYVYSATREGKILDEILRGYDGVVISDFYVAYDSLPCRQQKCLIHLIRDINEDILKNPFDVEMKDIGRDFTMLLVPIIETIDKYGLKKRNLNKHMVKVRLFFDKIEKINYSSEFTKSFQKRFIKYKDKLFTFLDNDDVPWNNNNAEHAVKRFVYLRRVIGGSSTVKGIQGYLILLSICETLRLKNVSFLQFLLSGATDMDKCLVPLSKSAA